MHRDGVLEKSRPIVKDNQFLMKVEGDL
jgi:hypothetical protein